jgi:hypothetical protein
MHLFLVLFIPINSGYTSRRGWKEPAALAEVTITLGENLASKNGDD